MPQQKHDPLLGVIRALPPDIWPQTIPALVEAVAEADPGYWLAPLTAEQAAAFLNTTTGALAQRRFKGGGPRYGRAGGVVRYGSRMELLRWARAEAGLDVERRAAA